MTTPTDVELMKAAVQHSHELYKLPTPRVHRLRSSPVE